MALEGYGLHRLLLKNCDEYIGGTLVASPADANGRGILFSMEEDGELVDLTGAEVYLLWHHRVSGKRGCEPFAVVADSGDAEWVVYYPAAMQETAGMVDAQIMASFAGERAISTRVFGIRVEPVVIGGEQSEDGFTLFLDVIKRYEEGAERVDELLAVLDDVSVIKGDKGDKGDKGEPGAPGADGAPGRDGIDGKDGKDGAEGVPGRDGVDGADGKDGADGLDGVGIASVVQTTTSTADSGINVWTMTLTDGTTSDFQVRNGRAGTSGGGENGTGADGVGIASVVQTTASTESGGENVVTVTLTNGDESSFSVLNGAKGEKGEKGDDGDPGADGTPGAAGAPGAKGEPGEKGDPFTYNDFTEEQLAALKGEKGDKGDPGEAGSDGAPGAKGDPGEPGDKGDKGDPFTFDDFTEEQLASLKGEKGDKGDKGDPGESGLAEIVVEAPLEVTEDGTLSINLVDYATKEYVTNNLPDLSGYATKAEIPDAVDAALENLTNLEELNY